MNKLADFARRARNDVKKGLKMAGLAHLRAR